MDLKDILALNDNQKIKKINQDVIIYGAGNFAKMCLSILRKHKFNILFFIDKEKYKNTSNIEGIPILSLLDSRLTIDIKNSVSCVLGIFNAYINLSLIEKELQRESFKNTINPLEFYDIYSSEIGDYFWLSNKEKYKTFLNKNPLVYNCLSDDTSKELFKNILIYRMSNKLESSPSPQNINMQYFPNDIDFTFPEIDLIDCGAYDGDTILNIIDKKLPLSSYVAFEPDIGNIKQLSINLKEKVDVKGYIYPCGVWNETVQLRFSGGTGSSSHISDDGNQVIQVISIDEVLINNPVNFIKMDIEGAEIQALNGASETIRKFHPILAISAYHKYDDLWTIPLLINSWKLDYSIFLRIYEFNGFGLVYYAIPKQYLKTKSKDKNA